MGNCLREKALDPNDQPLNIANPPAGVPPPRKIHTTQKKKKTSNILQESRSKDERCDYQHRQWRHSKSQKENQRIYINQNLWSNPRDISAKMEDVYHAYWRPIIHHDVKASNVLPDDILDWLGPLGGKSHISTRVLGTKGYFAPEYIAIGCLTVKTDVYSFGVVLLEIFLGKDAVKKYPNSLAGMWAKPYLSNRQELHRVVDQGLGKNIRMEEAQEFAQIILRCLSLEPKTRPTMTQVVVDLEQLELQMGVNQDFVRLSKC